MSDKSTPRPRSRPAKGTGKAASATAPSGAQAAPTPAAAPAASETSLAGQLLIAMPAMTDPRFAHAVIYMCAHSHEGAMGIVVNHPLSQPSFDDLLRQLKIEPVPPTRRIRLLAGGPVENARGFVLHTSDWTDEASLRVDGRVALTASLDVLKAIAGGGGPEKGILALGYAGWGPGQLDSEIQQNAWLSAPADLDVVFDADDGTKWRRALAVLHVNPLQLSGTAGRA
jgi:putative transcriptional regulator